MPVANQPAARRHYHNSEPCALECGPLPANEASVGVPCRVAELVVVGILKRVHHPYKRTVVTNSLGGNSQYSNTAGSEEVESVVVDLRPC